VLVNPSTVARCRLGVDFASLMRCTTLTSCRVRYCAWALIVRAVRAAPAHGRLWPTAAEAALAAFEGSPAVVTISTREAEKVTDLSAVEL
jgi:hypothetical protein